MSAPQFYLEFIKLLMPTTTRDYYSPINSPDKNSFAVFNEMVNDSTDKNNTSNRKRSLDNNTEEGNEASAAASTAAMAPTTEMTKVVSQDPKMTYGERKLMVGLPE